MIYLAGFEDLLVETVMEVIRDPIEQCCNLRKRHGIKFSLLSYFSLAAAKNPTNQKCLNVLHVKNMQMLQFVLVNV